MKQLLLFLFSVSFFSLTVAQEPVQDYRFGIGDLLQITVFDEPDLSIEVRLSGSGNVSYPFIGEIEVAGLTVSQLEQLLVGGLKGDYLIEPRINVSVKEYRPFYIYGEVEEPGGYEYSPGLSLRKALALAGGFTERASKSKIFSVAEGHSMERDRRRVTLDSIINPGDVITVEQSFF